MVRGTPRRRGHDARTYGNSYTYSYSYTTYTYGYPYTTYTYSYPYTTCTYCYPDSHTHGNS